MKASSRRDFLKGLGVAAAGGLITSSGLSLEAEGRGRSGRIVTGPMGRRVERVAADPADIPPPIHRDWPITHDITLRVEEVVAEIEPGVTFNFMTYNGQIPGPMIRVRQGDVVNLTIENPSSNRMPHNVDFHAVYGPGGGAAHTLVAPGQSKTIRFRCLYPGAYVYHCAVPDMDFHISSGMFGMILVEPPEGLPPVDREFYLGQHELYTDKQPGEPGHHNFDFEKLFEEKPTYVLFNGAKYGLTADRYGAMKAKVGETVRIFLAVGGPNLTSNFHPIGNVLSYVWREGAILNNPERNAQTVAVPPGSCGIFHMRLPVPGPVKFVDHALTRVARKGLLAVLEVEGPEQPDIYNPNPA